jgi:ribonuclease I
MKKKNIFSIHGLWPAFQTAQNVDCNTGVKKKFKIKGEVLEKMNTYWVNYKGPNPSFWTHEYNRHGWCFSKRFRLDHTAFFESTLEIYERYALDQLMIHSIGDLVAEKNEYTKYSYKELFVLIQNARQDLVFVIRCLRTGGRQYLHEIHFFFDLDLNPINYKRGHNCNTKKQIYVLFN